MKFALAALLPGALAAPASVAPRETLEAVTDRYLFSIPLPSFLQFRANKDPESLDWSSDGCSSSPDNPFGFPFQPACERHDFGYRNYKAQSRFDSNNRSRIDGNFKTDLLSQCEGVSAKGSCQALANVYYGAVRLFGGFSKRDEEDGEISGEIDTTVEESAEERIAFYYHAVEEYREAVKQDQANGLLPEQ